PNRLDVYRRLGPFAHGVEDPDAAAYFAATNHSKKGLAMDLESEEGRRLLEEVIRSSAAIVENGTTARLGRLGIYPHEFAAARGGRLFLSSTGYGRTGPAAAYRGFGQNIAAFGGLMALADQAAGDSISLKLPWADTVTGVFLASVLA